MNQENYSFEAENVLKDLEQKRINYHAKMMKKIKIVVTICLIVLIAILFNAMRINDFFFPADISGKEVVLDDKYTEYRDLEEKSEFNITKAIPAFAFCGFVLLCTILSLIFIRFRSRKSYVEYAKKNLIEPLMKILFSDMIYEANNFIPKSIFQESRLFTDFDSYGGDDYFKGMIDGKLVEFSELNVTKNVTESVRGSDSDKTVIETVFSGLFMKVELDKPVESNIVIDDSIIKANINNALSKVPEMIQGFLQRYIPCYGPEVSTGNEAFDSKFKVYSSNTDEVRHILSPALMEQVLKAYDFLCQSKNTNYSPFDMVKNPAMVSNLKISIKNNSLFFAVQNIKLFEFNLNSSIYKDQGGIAKSIKSITMLIEIAKTV